MSSSIEVIPPHSSTSTTMEKEESREDETTSNIEILQNSPSSSEQEQEQAPPKQIIRYSTSTLFALRSSKLSQQKPPCKNIELSCMIHHKPPPKMLIANMMPKFALNQMSNRGEESISPLSFHSNSSSSSNLSYQKRYQDGGGSNGAGSGNGSGHNDGFTNSRYYYNKYKNHDDVTGGNGGSRIIYKTTGANSSNGNNIRFLKKAYSSKYEEQEEPSSALGLISNKNILDNASRVITAADYRNTKKKILCGDEDGSGSVAVNDDKIGGGSGSGDKKKTPSDEANNNNNNSNKNVGGESERLTEVNANDLMMVRNDLNKKKLPEDITDHLDDIFNDMSLNQLLDDKISEERESSRFSKWFNVGDGGENAGNSGGKPDSQNNNNSTMFSIHETEKYFQPIDKMENNSMFNFPPQTQAVNASTAPQPQKSPGNSGQVHSVEELEAKLRHFKNEEAKNENEKKVLQNFFQQQLIPNLMQQQQQQHPPQLPNPQNQEEINAFKKLLSQMTADDNNKIPPQMMTPNGTNMLQQLMNKGFQQDMMMQQFPKGFNNIKAPPGAVGPPNKMHMMQPAPPQQQQQSQQFGGNLDLKFLQQPKISPAPLPEIIKRPEVQALVQELTSGEISQHNLWQRLLAPGLSPIEREIITCALNIFNANSNNANIFAKQQQQQPGMSNNLFPPSPQGNPTNATAAAVATQQALHQLMQQQMKVAASAGAPIPMPPQTSPLSPVPPTALDQHLLFQHQAANKQLRLSPLPAGMPQRIPSPRELQYHTQSIMQNALIRKKLEEQRENYRKRQEQEKQENAKKNQQEVTSSASSSEISDSSTIATTSAPASSQQSDDKAQQQELSPDRKKTAPIIQIQQRQHAPSPSIFTLTPTSVLRKMTAEKENDSKGDKKKILMAQQQAPQQSQPIRNIQQQQQFMSGNLSQLDRMKMAQNDVGMFGNASGGGNMNAWESQGMKPLGRPIVKSSPTQPTQANPMMAQQLPPNTQMMNFDFQQQQQQQIQQKMNLQKAQFLQQQQMMQMKKQQMDNPVLTQFMAQQQQRAQSQFRAQFQQQQSMNFAMMQQQQQGRDVKSDESLENRNMMNNGGCLSPTSNQLAKWFSPELLADASAGKLPQSLNNISGQMMSLEELEKCMQNS